MHPPCVPARKYTRSCNREGRSHFLALNTFHRRPLFEREHFCAGMLDLLPKICRQDRVELEAATLLPDRVMMVLRPKVLEINLRTWLEDLKAAYCVRMKDIMRPDDRRYLHCFRVREFDGSLNYRFWSEGLTQYGHADSEEERQSRIQYCYTEPVRRGLVDIPERWRWGYIQSIR